MKKILFLSCNYPYGPFGPSTLCTFRVMEALCQSGKYEVHCISYPESKNPLYRVLDAVHLHYLGQKPKVKVRSKFITNICNTFSMLTYPQSIQASSREYYKECLKLIDGQHYDLVVAQCYPEKCVWAGTWLKEKGYIDKLMVIFWDNIYGKLPRRVIPQSFAIKRQRKAEAIIARQADIIVSLYPIKSFYAQYGDLPEAEGKRKFLGIPSIAQPVRLPASLYKNVVKQGMINILYSGTIFRREYVSYLVDMFNLSKEAERINLIFFVRGVSDDDFKQMNSKFSGNIEHNGWIPLNELLALYPMVDFFMSFPGYPTSIRSKVFEYMSYGKPLMLLYDDDRDVNVSTFSRYPASFAIDVRKPFSENSKSVTEFILSEKGHDVPFHETERLFHDDTAKAYVSLIDEIFNKYFI